MNKNKYFIFAFLIFMSCTFFSCQKDLYNFVDTKVGISIEDAQMWYENNRPQGVQLAFAKVKESKKKLYGKPDWKHAYKDNNPDFIAIHVPLSVQGKFTIVTPERKKAYEETGDKRYIESLTQMVVVNYKKSSETYGFLMTIIPDREYQEATNFNAFHSFYKKWQKGYSGLIFYYTLDGVFTNGWRISDGKVTKSITPKDGGNIDVSLKAPGIQKSKTEDYDCYDYYYDVWYQDCTDWYTSTEYSTSYNGTSCGGVYMESTYLYTECYYTGDSGGGSSGGSGGSSGTNNSIYTSKFNLSGLTAAELKFLDDMYKRLKDDCVSNYINNALLQGNMPYGQITFDATMIGNAAISSSGNLTLGNGLDTEFSTFAHEWRHFYQRELNDMTTFGNKVGMMEFENAVYRDIETYQKGSALNLILFDMDEGYVTWIQEMERLGVLGNVTTRQDYIEWIKRLSTGAVDLTLPAEKAILQQWANLYGQYSTGYNTDRGYQYQGVDYPYNALSNLINILNNCK